MENFNRRDFLKGIVATGAASMFAHEAAADTSSEVEQAPDDKEFPMSFRTFKGFSIKFNKEHVACPVEAESFSSDNDGDRFHFVVNGKAFAHDFRNNTENFETEPISYADFKSKIISFLSVQAGLENCFPVS